MPIDKDTMPAAGSARLDDCIELVIESPSARMAMRIAFWGVALGLVIYFGTLRIIEWSAS